jgi:hypothetical protein
MDRDKSIGALSIILPDICQVLCRQEISLRNFLTVVYLYGNCHSGYVTYANAVGKKGKTFLFPRKIQVII